MDINSSGAKLIEPPAGGSAPLVGLTKNKRKKRTPIHPNAKAIGISWLTVLK
jgi:hypothetical protein